MLLTLLLPLTCLSVAQPPRVETVPTGRVWKLSIEEPDKRDCFVYAPSGISGESGVPLVVALGGRKGRAKLMVEKWRGAANEERLIVISPEVSSSAGWRMPEDGPRFIYDLVENLKESLPVDPRRVYLFGHSGGGNFAVLLGLMEPGYFAAVVAVGGALPVGQGHVGVDHGERRIPLSMIIGTSDPTLSPARQSREALAKFGFPVELKEVHGIGRDYYGNSRFLNKAAWAFLKDHLLEYPPYYKEYSFR